MDSKNPNRPGTGLKDGFVKGHDDTACGKTQSERQEVSGHDFSRAVNAAEWTWASAPEGNTLIGKNGLSS
jgi:hypothetical protein